MYTFAEVRIQGHVGKAPTVTGNVMKFNVAKSESWTDRDTGERRERTKWNTITVFDSNPGFNWIRDNLNKGDLVYIEAEVQNTSYEKNGETVYGVSIIADKVAIVPTGRNGN
ncbi:single-stranded DNA-binding protein [Ruegeria sp. HKCCD8929]|uniref:single-stranded DNA-binding protein n=1 Tax=Ruegeria sp. HKCCD8929 TaxID=2683006 RepID=UPI001488DCE4|nr:single-stranded DNA-binding protein [Ruegeria sp. HKCCD8929]